MKLTTTLMVALSTAIASAETTTITPFTESGWTNGSGRDRGEFTQDVDAGTFSMANSNWGQAYAYKDITAITLSKPTDSLTFSYTLTMGNQGNGAMTLTLVGSEKSIVSGLLCYNDAPKWKTGYAYTDYKPTGAEGSAVYTRDTIGADNVSNISTGLDGGSTLSFTGAIAWNATENRFEMSIGDGTSTVTGIDLGSSVNINRIYLSGDGANNATNGTLSGLSISLTTADTPVIPEPATATLSLLALAGLAARRRRK